MDLSRVFRAVRSLVIAILCVCGFVRVKESGVKFIAANLSCGHDESGTPRVAAATKNIRSHVCPFVLNPLLDDLPQKKSSQCS